MNILKKLWGKTLKKPKETFQELNEDLFTDIHKSKTHWEEAYMYFQEALGEDQVDYAIFMLEAAERKYQMHLKRAKKLGISADHYLRI